MPPRSGCSLHVCTNAAPAQRAQPPCLLSFQRASRRCHAAPRRFRYCSERLFRHAQALPPRSGCSLHVCSLFQRTSRLCLTPGAAPNISSVTRERCPRAAGATRILQFFQRSRRRCPHFPAWPPDTAPAVFPVTRERFPHAAGATSSHRGRGTSVEMEMLRCGCPRATGATRSFQSFQRTSRRCHHFPASPPMLLQMSLPSCANVSTTQMVQPSCLQPFQRTDRLCPTPVLPRTSLPPRANAAPAQRA